MNTARFLSVICGIILLIVVWGLTSNLVHDAFLPGPIFVFKSIISSIDIHMANARVTSIEALLGFSLASFLSAGTVCLVGLYPKLENFFYPSLIMMKASPAVAFVPLFMVIVGSGIYCKVLVSAMISFFPLIIGGIDGIKDTPIKLINIGIGYGTSRWRLFWYIKFNYAVRGFMTGSKTAAPLSVVGAIVGEYVAGGSPSGLGHFIMVQNAMFAMDEVLAATVIATILGVVFFSIAFILAYIFERRCNIVQ